MAEYPIVIRSLLKRQASSRTIASTQHVKHIRFHCALMEPRYILAVISICIKCGILTVVKCIEFSTCVFLKSSTCDPSLCIQKNNSVWLPLTDNQHCLFAFNPKLKRRTFSFSFFFKYMLNIISSFMLAVEPTHLWWRQNTHKSRVACTF